MINVQARVDARNLVLRLERGQKRLAFAVAQGINDTAKRLQLAQQENVDAKFTLRSATAAFVRRNAAVIKPFANARQGRPFAEIAVGQRKRLLLGQYEVGGKREPFKGRRVAVPITGNAARPSFTQPVKEQLRITKLGLRKVRGGTSPRYEGKLGTFMIPSVGVFQRTGPRREDVNLLYFFDEDVRLPKSLGFRALAESRAGQWLNVAIDDALARELARAR